MTMDANEKKIKIIRYIILALSILLIGIGIARGEASVVLTKASSICTQCIGIG